MSEQEEKQRMMNQSEIQNKSHVGQSLLYLSMKISSSRLFFRRARGT